MVLIECALKFGSVFQSCVAEAGYRPTYQCADIVSTGVASFITRLYSECMQYIYI